MKGSNLTQKDKMKVTKSTSEAYTWGHVCKGWHLVNTKALSVIQEMMPPGTQEVKHRHAITQQFFYILKGQAVFEVEGKEIIINKEEGIHIKANLVHQIKNKTDSPIEFIVISQPHSHGDRILEDE